MFYQLQRLRTRILWLIATATLAGCYAPALRNSTVKPEPLSITSGIEARPFKFNDSGNAIFYTLEKSLSDRPSVNIATYVFVVGGSGCSSMRYFLPRYFKGLEGESGPLRIFMLQKRHVDDFDWKKDRECGRDFVVDDHPQRWLADHLEFLQSQLAAAGARRQSPHHIVIVGISEGGDIAAQLAKSITSVTHLVIIGNGGMQPLDAYKLQLQRYGLAHQLTELNAIHKLPSDPDDVKNDIAGRSWRYWSELSQIKHTENLLTLEIPVWIAMGEDDHAVPVESARYIENRFLAKGKSNLHIRIYKGADHGLADRQKNNLLYFWHDFDASMRR